MRLVRRALWCSWLVVGLTVVTNAGASPLTTGRVEPVVGFPSDTGGFSGDGGEAAFAQLWGPRDLAFDAAGNLYIADDANGRIRRVDPHGTITTFAGKPRHGFDAGDGGPARNADLSPPHWLAAAGGKLFLLGAPEDDLHTYVRVVSGGSIQRFAGTTTPGFSGDGGPAVNALLDHPRGLATDSAGNVYIGDKGRIRKVSASGIITTIAGTGTYGFAGDGGQATAAQIDAVLALATDRHGNLYVAGGNRVRRIAPTGIITTVAGTGAAGFSGDGGPATQAGIGTPSALAVDTDGTLFLADIAHHRVRAVTPSGTITTIAGNGRQGGYPAYGLARKASITYPSGLALDGKGRLFISSYGSNAVLRYTRGLTGAAAGRCSRDAARAIFERGHVGNAGSTAHPEGQVFCGSFAGRRSRTMVASVSIPSCGLSIGWYVWRSVHGRWMRILKVNHGALLTRSRGSIHEWQGVLAPNDAHCLPSSARVRDWHWNGSRLLHGAWHRRARLPRHLPGRLRF